MNLDLFYIAPCLSDDLPSISAESLRKKWFPRSDKRYLRQALHKFLAYNQDCLDFLDIAVQLQGVDNQVSIRFLTNKYIGAIPLRAPDTGKQIGDFLVHPRAARSNDKYSEISKLMFMLEEAVRPEHHDSTPLVSGISVSPPLYYDALLYIDYFEKVISSRWHKFQTVKREHPHPKSGTDWNEYIRKEFDPSLRFIFPCRDNVLSIIHKEFEHLKYVFEIAKEELLQPTTPHSIRSSAYVKLEILTRKTDMIPSTPCRSLHVRTSDPLFIKKSKEQGNILLRKAWTNTYAWRMDIAVLFERFVQFLLNKAAREIGAKSVENSRFHARGQRLEWGLGYLEPDVVLVKGNRCIFADAKYKMHFYNLGKPSDKLKEAYREDLHQLLAYCSFDSSYNKIGLLIYPSSFFSHKMTKYTNGVNLVENTVILIGVPFDSDSVDEVNTRLKELLQELFMLEA